MVKPIPDGYPRVTPYLIVDGASAAIDFYNDGARRQGAHAHGRARTARSATPSSRSATR